MSVLWSILSNVQEVLRSFRGALFVQVQSLGFWQGKQFRAYREFSLTANQSVTWQLIASAPFLLQNQDLYTESGSMRAVITVGATPSGTWTPISTLHPKFRIGMNPTSSVSIFSGGTVAGGEEREVLRGASGTGGPVSRSGSGQHSFGTRGLPATTFYITLTAGAEGGTGMYSIEWEDL